MERNTRVFLLHWCPRIPSLVCLAFPLPLPEEECLVHQASGFLHPLRLFGTLCPINVSWTKSFYWQCFPSSEHCIQSMYPEQKSIFFLQCLASSEYCVQSMYPKQKSFLLTMFRLFGILRPIDVSWTKKIFVDNVSPLRNTASTQCILNKKVFYWQCFASSEHCVQSMYPETRKFFVENLNFYWRWVAKLLARPWLSC